VSSDLLNWKNSGLVLSVTSEGQHPEVAKAGVLDRPKVIFNPATRKFVMYFRLYPPKAAGGTYYDAILPSLVLLHRADPARVAAMPGQIDSEADKKRVLDPEFKFDAKNPCSGGVINSVREYYTELEPPAADAPGHSIVPNLLMHEIAKRDGLADPDRYLSAAVKQAEWTVQNLDWNDPRTTKGHRMSERRTIPSLVWMLQNHPDHAPAGLKEKITAWSEVAAKRSANLCDIRRFDDGYNWTIPKLNDVGNWLATPGIALAASWVIDDPKLKSRMRETAVSHADAVFGRNPRLAAAPNKPELGFTGIERGWPISHKPKVCARLELCRGSISAAPGSEMFPFYPDGAYRHAEGWVNYGAAWCLSLAHFEFDRHAGKAP
jgi:hypothetical protein